MEELVRQQRELLRLFHSSITRRVQVETEAQRQWQKAQELREQARATHAEAARLANVMAKVMRHAS